MNDLRAAVCEIFNRARDEASALIESQVSQQQRSDVSDPEWGTMGQAAALRRCTEQTMARLVIAHGLGTKTGGRWRVDLQRVKRWQAGERYDRLDPLPEG